MTPSEMLAVRWKWGHSVSEPGDVHAVHPQGFWVQLGKMDSPELAAHVVHTHNEWLVGQCGCATGWPYVEYSCQLEREEAP